MDVKCGLAKIVECTSKFKVAFNHNSYMVILMILIDYNVCILYVFIVYGVLDEKYLCAKRDLYMSHGF